MTIFIIELSKRLKTIFKKNKKIVVPSLIPLELEKFHIEEAIKIVKNQVEKYDLGNWEYRKNRGPERTHCSLLKGSLENYLKFFHESTPEADRYYNDMNKIKDPD